MTSRHFDSAGTWIGPQSRKSLLQPDGSPITVLVIDDDRVAAEIVSIMLSWEGADVVTAHDAAQALMLARRHRPDLVIVDPHLPRTDALSLMLTLRQQLPEVLVLILVPAGSPNERIARFATGCEYLTKPFSVEELSLRVRILLARREYGPEGRLADVIVGDLILDEEGREVTRRGRAITLTYTEFELMRFFARNPHRVVTKEQILARVWPYGFSGRSNIVELYISGLRKKIHRGATPIIHTLRLSGYILKPDGPARLNEVARSGRTA